MIVRILDFGLAKVVAMGLPDDPTNGPKRFHLQERRRDGFWGRLLT